MTIDIRVDAITCPYVIDKDTVGTITDPWTSPNAIYADGNTQWYTWYYILAYVARSWQILDNAQGVEPSTTHYCTGSGEYFCDDYIGLHNWVSSPPKSVIRADLIIDPPPAYAKEYFPGSGLYRIGHYAWMFSGSHLYEQRMDLQIIRSLNNFLQPPLQQNVTGLFVHLYPGFSATLNMAMNSRVLNSQTSITREDGLVIPIDPSNNQMLPP